MFRIRLPWRRKNERLDAVKQWQREEREQHAARRRLLDTAETTPEWRTDEERS